MSKETISQPKIGYWLIAIVIVLLVVEICCHISNCVVSESNIVLTFVGILATFVVVSNYAQVKSIEDKMESEITHLNEELEKLRREKKEMRALVKSYDERLTLNDEEKNQVRLAVLKELKGKEKMRIGDICGAIQIENKNPERKTKYISDDRIESVVWNMIESGELKKADNMEHEQKSSYYVCLNNE